MKNDCIILREKNVVMFLQHILGSIFVLENKECEF